MVIHTVYFGLGLMILPSFLALHAIQMFVTWQNEHNAVHNAEIVDNLGKFILCHPLAYIPPGTLIHLLQFVH